MASTYQGSDVDNNYGGSSNMSFSSGIGGIIGDAIGGITQNMFMEEDRNQRQEYANDRAREAREYNTTLSSTAHQREVGDLIAAGLNPALAYHNTGAASPAGVMAQSPSAAYPENALKGSVQSAASAENLMAGIDLLRAQTAKTGAEQKEVEARTPTYAISMSAMQQQINESIERIAKIRQETATGAASAAELEARRAVHMATVDQLNALVKQLNAQTKLTGSQNAEVVQRIQANLPSLEAAVKTYEAIVKGLEGREKGLGMNRKIMESAVADSPAGALGAVWRELSPFQGLISIPR